MRISDLLKCGEENAIHGDELARMLNMSGRNLRKAIENERIAGEAILSSEKGYFLPSDVTGVQELKTFLALFQSRRKTTDKVIKTAKKHLKRMEEGEVYNGEKTGFHGV